MTLSLYHVTTGERREIDADLWAEWEANGNPKRLDWALLPDPPAVAAGEVARWDAASKTWQVVGDEAPLPDAERYQVRAWLLRMAHEHDRPELHPDQIPAYLASITAPGLEREEALDRWANVSRIPANHPLVLGVAQSLGLEIRDIWPGILAL